MIVGEMDKSIPMPMCPMAAMCRGMMQRRASRFAMVIPGVIFIVLGVLVFVEPRILVWFVAFALIAMGIFMLMFTSFVSKISRDFGASADRSEQRMP